MLSLLIKRKLYFIFKKILQLFIFIYKINISNVMQLFKKLQKVIIIYSLFYENFVKLLI